MNDFPRRHDRIGQSDAAPKPHTALPQNSIRTHHPQEHERAKESSPPLPHRSTTPTNNHETRRGEVPSHSPIRTPANESTLSSTRLTPTRTRLLRLHSAAQTTTPLAMNSVTYRVCNRGLRRVVTISPSRTLRRRYFAGDSPGRIGNEMPGDAKLCRLRAIWSLLDPVPGHHFPARVRKVCKSVSSSLMDA